MRSQLADAFEESLRGAPDPADVLVGIRGGIDLRRRRRRLYRTGGAAAAVVLAMIASTITVIAIRSADSPPVGGVDPIPLGEWTNTLQLGWVPDGWRMTSVESTAIDETITYLSDDDVSLRVFLDKVDQSPRSEMAGWDRSEINSRPAWERNSHDNVAGIIWQLESGRWAALEVAGKDPRFGARDIAKRIAESVHETGSARLTTGFAPTYLPGGLRIIGVRLEPGPGAPAGQGTIVCASGSLRVESGGSRRNDGRLRTGIDMGLGAEISVIKNQPEVLEQDPQLIKRIPDIQGRPAYLMFDWMVYVTDFHGGMLRVTPRTAYGPNAVPVAELVKIAEGVRWVG